MTELIKVVVALDWTPNGNHLGFYVAKDAGLYEAAGLDVHLLAPNDPEFAGSYVAPTDEGSSPYVTPCSKVAAGDAHFAINSPEGVVGWNTALERPALKAVAALINDRNTSAIVTLKSSGRSRPKELDGCRYASYAARFEGRIVQRMIQNDGGAGEYVEFTPPMLGIWNTLLGKAAAREEEEGGRGGDAETNKISYQGDSLPRDWPKRFREKFVTTRIIQSQYSLYEQ